MTTSSSPTSPTETVVILGSGPSLTSEDVALCRPLFTIAINNSVYMAPWAQVCFAADYHWWSEHRYLPTFGGRKIGMHPAGEMSPPDLFLFHLGQTGGIDHRLTHLADGRNSGFSAIGFAVTHLHAKRILLLGFDMQPVDGRHHWHDPHNAGDPHPSYTRCIELFNTLTEPLTSRGVTVLNCSPSSAISAFPKRTLRGVLECQESR